MKEDSVKRFLREAGDKIRENGTNPGLLIIEHIVSSVKGKSPTGPKITKEVMDSFLTAMPIHMKTFVYIQGKLLQMVTNDWLSRQEYFECIDKLNNAVNNTLLGINDDKGGKDEDTDNSR